MSGDKACKVIGPEPEIYIPLSKVREIAEEVMRNTKELTADSTDYRIGQWSGAEKVKFAVDCWATTHRTHSTEAKHDEPRWQKVPKYWRPTAHAYVVHPAGCKGIYTSVGSERYFLDIHQMGVDQSEYVNYSSKEQE